MCGCPPTINSGYVLNGALCFTVFPDGSFTAEKGHTYKWL